MSSSLRSRSAASVAILLAATATTHAAGPALIALSGTATPGGGNYINFTAPVLNSNGQVAFNANISGGTSTSGIFTGTSASLSAIALQGTSAPSGGNFGNLFTSTSTELSVINSGGQLAFAAPLTGSTSNSGIFTGTSAATLQTVALQATAAPAGGNYSSFLAQGTNSAYSPVLNNLGQVAIQASLTGGTSSAGVFAGTAASLAPVALVGGTSPNGNYTLTATVPTINGNGQVAFISLFSSSQQAIYAQNSSGTVQVIMANGGNAPGTSSGTGGQQLYANPGSTVYSFNNAGQVGFQAALTNGPSTAGVFVGSAGNVQPVVLNNTQAAGPVFNLYNTFSSVSVNSAGRTAFSASLYGGTSASGLFVGTPTSVTAVALAGTTSPDGDTYSAFGSSELQNGMGQVAFVAIETGPTIVANSNDRALYGGTPGNLQTIVADGQTLDLGPSTGGNEFRTIAGGPSSISLIQFAGGQDGKGMSFDDNGDLAYKLTFTDGSIGIFESNVNSVPEPASLGLLAAGAGLLIRRNRRRPAQFM